MTITFPSEEEGEQAPNAPESEEEIAELWRQVADAATSKDGETDKGQTTSFKKTRSLDYV